MRNKFLLYLIFSSLCFAHDTITPHQEDITLEWTIENIEHKIPSVELSDGSPETLLKFLSSPDFSATRNVTLDYSAISFPEEVTIDYSAEDVPWINIVKYIATKVEAEVIIKPGKVVLLPKKKSNRGSRTKRSNASELINTDEQFKNDNLQEEDAKNSFLKQKNNLWVLLLIVILLFLCLRKRLFPDKK